MGFDFLLVVVGCFIELYKIKDGVILMLWGVIKFLEGWGGEFLIIGWWVCVVLWGGIFMIGLIILYEVECLIVIRIGFYIFEVKKILVSRN